MDGDDQYCISFAIAQRTLLCQPILGWIGENSLIQPPLIIQAFQNGLEDCKASINRLHCDDPLGLVELLASFHPETPELTRPECVQQSSISTPICFTTICYGDSRPNRLHTFFAMYFLVVIIVNWMPITGIHCDHCVPGISDTSLAKVWQQIKKCWRFFRIVSPITCVCRTVSVIYLQQRSCK